MQYATGPRLLDRRNHHDIAQPAQHLDRSTLLRNTQALRRALEKDTPVDVIRQEKTAAAMASRAAMRRPHLARRRAAARFVGFAVGNTQPTGRLALHR